MQLNMHPPPVITGEKRQLIAGTRLEILPLQGPYAQKPGSRAPLRGLEAGVGVAASHNTHEQQ